MKLAMRRTENQSSKNDKADSETDNDTAQDSGTAKATDARYDATAEIAYGSDIKTCRENGGDTDTRSRHTTNETGAKTAQ